MIERFRAVPGRFKALLLLAILLGVLAGTGRLQASSGIEIERDQAVEIARSELDFQPERADARIVRQGFVLRPVWAVSFSVPTPDGDQNDFDRLLIVEVDAISGEILTVSDESPDSPESTE